jgi:hypothetical protein
MLTGVGFIRYYPALSQSVVTRCDTRSVICVFSHMTTMLPVHVGCHCVGESLLRSVYMQSCINGYNCHTVTRLCSNFLPYSLTIGALSLPSGHFIRALVFPFSFFLVSFTNCTVFQLRAIQDVPKLLQVFR